MALTLPNGSIINRSSVGEKIDHDLTSNFEYYMIKDTLPGEWNANLNGTSVPFEGENTTLVIMSLQKTTDYNGDGIVDTKDAITVLQLLAGQSVNIEFIDVNNDGCVGMPELLNVMRSLAFP